jgi:hypothetical protein
LILGNFGRRLKNEFMVRACFSNFIPEEGQRPSR